MHVIGRIEKTDSEIKTETVEKVLPEVEEETKTVSTSTRGRKPKVQEAKTEN